MDKILANLHIVVLLLFAMGLYSTYTEYTDKLDAAEGQFNSETERLDKKKKEYKSIEAYNKDIERAKVDLELAREAIEKLQKQLPSEVSNTENLEILSSIASALNIKNVSLTPGQEEDRGFYIAKEYGLKASGTFLQFIIFFERLAKEQRLFNVKNVSLTIGGHRQKGRFQMIDGDIRVEAYKYNSNYKESSGVDEIEKESKTPDKPRKRRKKAKAAGDEE